MLVRVLGTAAGGGFPQWNCGCPGCGSARQNPDTVPGRLQSGMAVSSDGSHWMLVNASPDITRQIELFLRPDLPAVTLRHSPIGRIFLTNADLDHVLGLFQLREGGGLDLTAPSAVRASVQEGLNFDRVLGAYASVEWREAPEDWAATGNGALDVKAVPLDGTDSPRYWVPDRVGLVQAVGYLFRDRITGRTVGIFPDVAKMTPDLHATLESCDLVFFDGTFWTNDEMVRLGLTDRDAAAMGHLPISGPGGSLEKLRALDSARCVYLHINNTNPILDPSSPERRELNAAGVEVAEDGARFEL